MKVKICGITRLEDAALACELGAWALGFVFYPPSPRHISPERAREIVSRLPDSTLTVGVFVNESAENIREAVSASGVRMAQFHGDETPGQCAPFQGRLIKAFHLDKDSSLETLARYAPYGHLLIESAAAKAGFGGTGALADWDIARRAKEYGDVILAGGIGPGNIREAFETVEPFAVDLSSSVEDAPGVKNKERMKELFGRLEP